MKTFRSFRSVSPSDERLPRQQALALAHHCRLAVETMHPRFRWIEAPHSIVLTVNTGYE